MTPERAAELLPIIQAYAEGKTIQWRLDFGLGDDREWTDCTLENILTREAEFRVKPEPKVIYVNEFGVFAQVFGNPEQAEEHASRVMCDRVAVRYIEASD